MGCGSSVDKERSQKEIVLKWRASHSSSVRSSLISPKNKDIEEDYFLYTKPEDILGKGACGVVVVGEKKSQQSDNCYAIKICNKRSSDVARLEREVLLLKDVDHCNVVRLFHVYDTPQTMYFVTELCTGGHLGNLISKQKKGGVSRLEEQDARVLCRQLLSAVRHLHERGIAHRDIKLQNILIDQQVPQSVYNGKQRLSEAINLKIIDFGYGSRYVGVCPMKTVCGTPYTTAPEVLRESYDERCDVWSVGVVLFIMLCGKRPFEMLNISGPLAEAGKAAMITNILAGRYSFGTESWQGVGEEAKSFVKELLHPNYLRRVQAKDAMLLPWMRELTSTSMKVQSDKIRTISRGLSSANVVLGAGASAKVSPDIVPLDGTNDSSSVNNNGGDPANLINGDELLVTNILKNNKDTSAQGGMRRCGNMALAFGLQESAVRDIRTLFQTVDLDGSGALSKAEFSEAMIILCPTLHSTDCDLVFDSMDINRDDQITFTEFLAATINPHAVDIAELNNAFELLDSNNDGFISLEELRKMYSYRHMKKKTPPQSDAPPVIDQTSPPKMDKVDSNQLYAASERRPSVNRMLSETNPSSSSLSGKGDGNATDTTTDATDNKHKDKDGEFTMPRIFTDVMSNSVTLQEQVEHMMAACDIDHDGMISHEEFIFAMTGAMDLFHGNKCQASHVLIASASKSKLKAIAKDASALGGSVEETKTPTPAPGEIDYDSVKAGLAVDDSFSEEQRRLSLTPKIRDGQDLSVCSLVDGV